MKKCPRCQRDVNGEAKFCPHCGLDLSASLPKKKNKNGPMQNIKHIIALVLVLSVPFLYTTLTSNGGSISNILNSTEVTTLGEYTGKDALLVKGQYDNLIDFNANYTNVSEYVNNIVAYENKLASDNNVYDKEYVILVLDNNQVLFHLEYTTRINNC